MEAGAQHRPRGERETSWSLRCSSPKELLAEFARPRPQEPGAGTREPPPEEQVASVLAERRLEPGRAEAVRCFP